MSVTSLDAAAGRDLSETSTVLADMVAAKMRPAAWDLAVAISSGNRDDAEAFTRCLSYRELQALVLHLAACASQPKLRQACGPRCPGCGKSVRAQANSVPGSLCMECRKAGGAVAVPDGDVAEYAHLRDGRVSPEFAAWRAAGIAAPEAVARLEAAYQASRQRLAVA